MVFGADMKFDTGKAMTAAKDAAAIAPNAPGTSACDLFFINRIRDLNDCLKEAAADAPGGVHKRGACTISYIPTAVPS
jgi:hypothetical protein